MNKFFAVIANLIAMLLVVFSAASAAAQDAPTYKVGEFVPYDAGRNFHIELRTFLDSQEVSNTIKVYAGRENPAAYTYKVSQRARDGDAGFRFAPCSLKVTIKVTGLDPAVQFAGREFDITNADRKKLGSITPFATGPGWVEFKLVVNKSMNNIVLPFTFVGEKNPPTMIITTDDWKPTDNPFCKGNVCTSEFLHRISRSKGVGDGRVKLGDGRVNSGWIPPGLIVAADDCKT